MKPDHTLEEVVGGEQNSTNPKRGFSIKETCAITFGLMPGVGLTALYAYASLRGVPIKELSGDEIIASYLGPQLVSTMAVLVYIIQKKDYNLNKNGGNEK